MTWVGNVAHTGQKQNAYRVQVGKLERKRILGSIYEQMVEQILVPTCPCVC